MAGATGRGPSLKDVAARAGVSWKTVSNVINEHPHVSAGTRAKVEAAIAELGYRPNASGRRLRTGRSQLLGLAIADIRIPYFAELAHAVATAAEPRGYTVLIDETAIDRTREERVAAGLRGNTVDGLIFSPEVLSPSEVIRLSGGIPTILLGEHALAEDVAVDRIGIDNGRAMRQLIQHLAATGRRTVAYVGASVAREFGPGQTRMRAYRDALAGADLAVDDGLMRQTDRFSRADGYRAVLDLLATRPDVDAIVCGNDQVAIGACAALRSLRRSVPSDVAVTGWDDSEEGRYSSPTLTTVRPDLRALAAIAVDRVLVRVEEPSVQLVPIRVAIPHEIVVRESSAS